MKRTLISLCIPFLVCIFASGSYADEVTLEYESGIYKGEASNGVAHGQGTFTFAAGGNYVGRWKEGNYHGQGRLIFPNGAIYVGEFKNGNWEGQGTFTFPNGRKFIGEWKGNKPWNGTEYDKDGNVTATYVGGARQAPSSTEPSAATDESLLSTTVALT
jgi:hypothetical protein